jgi:DNA-binding NarL/FixJ family response regulator
MKRIFVIDDHPMVLEGLKILLGNIEGLVVSGTAENAYQALELLKMSLPDVILCDINLPDTNGIDLTKQIKDLYPSVKILGLSTFNERSYITRMMQNGASGYLLKNAAKEEILEAIDAVMAGKKYLSFEVTDMLLQNPAEAAAPIAILTRREKEVLGLIAEGLTNPEIAEKLFVSPLTVDSHRKNLLHKLQAKNTAALVAVAVKNGLI